MNSSALPRLASPHVARLRLGLALALLALLLVAGKLLGLTEWTPEEVRTMVGRAGAWSYLVYASLFTAGELLHVPGMVFVGAAVLAFGKVAGFVASFVASILSVGTSFWIVRAIGGRALSSSEHPILRRALSHLESHPVRTVLLLRTVLWLAPALNYALALSGISFRHYILGSALGLLAPVGGAALFFDWLLR